MFSALPPTTESHVHYVARLLMIKPIRMEWTILSERGQAQTLTFPRSKSSVRATIDCDHPLRRIATTRYD
jgi:hypothetical protein